MKMMTKKELYNKHPQFKCDHTLEYKGFNALLHNIYECTKCKILKFSTKNA